MKKQNINNELSDRLQAHLQKSSYKTLDQLIEYILEKYLDDNEGMKDDKPQSPPEAVNQRLKDLGYL